MMEERMEGRYDGEVVKVIGNKESGREGEKGRNGIGTFSYMRGIEEAKLL